jgi:hypothetical protein
MEFRARLLLALASRLLEEEKKGNGDGDRLAWLKILSYFPAIKWSR